LVELSKEHGRWVEKSVEEEKGVVNAEVSLSFSLLH